MTLNHCSLRLVCLMGMIVMSVGCSKEGKGDGAEAKRKNIEDMYETQKKEGKGDGAGTGKVPPLPVIPVIPVIPPPAPLPVIPVMPGEMVEVEGGILWVDSNGNRMNGPTIEDREGKVSEQKYEEIRIGKFWVGKCEVTWGQWKEVREWGKGKGYEMGQGAGNGEKYPVTDVRWYSAVKWCNARSEKEGLVPVYEVGGEVYRKGSEDKVAMKVGANGYRLPSDGEWEWAARGGVKGRGYEYSGSNDLEEVGWCGENSGVNPHEAGTKKANELGIYDMSGNVWEWCFDWAGGGATGTNRVIRGGSWSDYAHFARVSYRSGPGPSLSYNNFGFRVARSSVP
jgi:sulfatase modifying factor 1